MITLIRNTNKKEFRRFRVKPSSVWKIWTSCPIELVEIIFCDSTGEDDWTVKPISVAKTVEVNRNIIMQTAAFLITKPSCIFYVINEN